MNICYHYTTLRALHEIVRSQSFHLGSVLFMNDYMELEGFLGICRSVAEEARNRLMNREPVGHSEHPSAIETVTSSLSSDNSISLLYYYDHLVTSLLKLRFDHIYCGCFSHENDDLSQWRGYADNARGVCIGIDLDVVKGANPSCPNLRDVENTTRTRAIGNPHPGA